MRAHSSQLIDTNFSSKWYIFLLKVAVIQKESKNTFPSFFELHFLFSCVNGLLKGVRNTVDNVANKVCINKPASNMWLEPNPAGRVWKNRAINRPTSYLSQGTRDPSLYHPLVKGCLGEDINSQVLPSKSCRQVSWCYKEMMMVNVVVFRATFSDLSEPHF